MKRLAAHRLHRLDALKVKSPPPVKGFASDTVPAAQIFDTHSARKLAQDFLSNFVCNLHGLKNEARARVCVPGFFGKKETGRRNAVPFSFVKSG